MLVNDRISGQLVEDAIYLNSTFIDFQGKVELGQTKTYSFVAMYH